MRRVFPVPVHRPIYALRRLSILTRVEDSAWISFSALFRADPCLRLLDGLEQDLMQKVQRMTVGCFAQKIAKIEKYLTHTTGSPRDPPCSPGNLHPLDARQNAASPNDDTSNLRDVRSNIRTIKVDTTGQPNDTAYHDLSGGHSTGIETMSTGTGASNLRQRIAHLDPSVSRLPPPTQLPLHCSRAYRQQRT